jgi:hypothetical protein
MIEQLRSHATLYPEDDATQKKIEANSEWEKYKVHLFSELREKGEV